MSDYKWIRYTQRNDGNNIKVEIAEGTLSYTKVGEFWLPMSFHDERNGRKRADIIKKRVREVMGWNTKGTPVEIHLSYFTGELK